MSTPSFVTDALLQSLELEEKILLLTGKNLWETHDVERLQIPSLKVTDGPSGARGAHFHDGTPAACFPACVSLASTFDRDLAGRVGKALAEETQTKGAYVLLGPTLCIHRSPLGGRNFEAFSEDPLLSGLLGAEYVKGLQSERVAATIKHYFANEQDTRRFVVNETVSERALREIYLKPFEIAIKKADPWCLMTAYPKVNGSYIDASRHYLDGILRDDWGYKGLTMSDWGAGTTVNSIHNGLDLEMPGPARWREISQVQQALRDGIISESDIDARVKNILQLLHKVGKFSDRVETPEEQAIDRPEHRALIREAGAAGTVLLKNEGNVLPIDLKSTKKIALLGPLAKHASAHGGGSSFLTCHHKISPFEAFSQRVPSDVELTYSKGTHVFRSLPDLIEGTSQSNGKPGFTVEYFESHDGTGDAFLISEVHRSYFTTHDQPDLKEKAMSARLIAIYRPSETGSHYLSLSGAGETKLSIDNKIIAHQAGNIKDAMAFISGVQDELWIQYPFVAGQSYEMLIETSMPDASISDNYILDRQLCAHVGFVSQAEMEQDLLSEAVNLAKEADVALIFTGNTFQWESEGQDMDAMVLPPYKTRTQDQLVSAVAAVNPKTIVINTTGVPVELPWLESVEGFLQTWYAGQEIGHSIVDVLLGDVSPSGKLPVSWPRLYEHTACYGNFGVDSYESCEVEYVEGVFVGYRHFDRHWSSEKEVRYPFGFGLSYTQFEVELVSVTGSFENSSEETISIRVRVKNTGSRAGAETVQVYVSPPTCGSVERPIKTLAGFVKAQLQPGEEQVVEVKLDRDAAAYWDEDLGKWKVSSGLYKLLTATSSHPDDVKSTATLSVKEDFTF